MRIATLKDLGLILRDRRKALGIGQSDLAAKIGVSRQWLVQIERGKPRADAGLLLRALKALDLDLEVTARKSKRPAASSVERSARQSPGSTNRREAGEYIDLDALIEKARGTK